jgi:hypothetical protein
MGLRLKFPCDGDGGARPSRDLPGYETVRKCLHTWWWPRSSKPLGHASSAWPVGSIPMHFRQYSRLRWKSIRASGPLPGFARIRRGEAECRHVALAAPRPDVAVWEDCALSSGTTRGDGRKSLETPALDLPVRNFRGRLLRRIVNVPRGRFSRIYRPYRPGKGRDWARDERRPKRRKPPSPPCGPASNPPHVRRGHQRIPGGRDFSPSPPAATVASHIEYGVLPLPGVADEGPN